MAGVDSRCSALIRVAELGTAVGLAIMTIIYDRVLEREANKAGIPYHHGIENTVGSPVVFKALQSAFCSSFLIDGHTVKLIWFS